MRIVIQKVKKASVEVDNVVISQIGRGFLLLVGLEVNDTEIDINKAVEKVANIRLFEDENGKINKSLFDVDGFVLSVSQFTLGANIQKGNRPSFIDAMRPELAKDFFDLFNDQLRDKGLNVETGKFQADMEVSLINDGPVTIIMNVKDGKVY